MQLVLCNFTRNSSTEARTYGEQSIERLLVKNRDSASKNSRPLLRFGNVELGAVCGQNAGPGVRRAAFSLAQLNGQQVAGSIALLTSK